MKSDCVSLISEQKSDDFGLIIIRQWYWKFNNNFHKKWMRVRDRERTWARGDS